jgi:hypothetical protein
MAQRNGTGIFPRELMNRFPLLPVEEEGRLNDLPLRENFIERVFAYYRWVEVLDKEPTPGSLVPGKPIQGRQVPYGAQADADGPPSPGRAARSTIPKSAASSPTPASGIGTS